MTTYEDKNVIIFDGQEKDSKIIVKQGEIFVTYANAYGKWVPAFHKDTKGSVSNEIYALKQQLKHVYEVAPKDFLSIVKLLNPNGNSYKIVREVLNKRLTELESEMVSIKKVLN